MEGSWESSPCGVVDVPIADVVEVSVRGHEVLLRLRVIHAGVRFGGGRRRRSRIVERMAPGFPQRWGVEALVGGPAVVGGIQEASVKSVGLLFRAAWVLEESKNPMRTRSFGGDRRAVKRTSPWVGRPRIRS